MNQEYIVKIGEIALKGKNRHFFENRMKSNVINRMQNTGASIRGNHGRYFLNPGEADESTVHHILSKTFGVTAYGRVWKTKKMMEDIRTTTLEVVRSILQKTTGRTFKIEARRTDKRFPLNSYEIACDLGALLIRNFPHLKVDVKHPDWIVSVEIRERALVYGLLNPGPGGLPTGIAGKGILMLSGGIDSPVAGYMMAKRGLKLDAVYFHAYPYTSDEAKQKVITLAHILAEFTGRFNLYVIPFTEAQIILKKKARESELTLLMRACMVRIAQALADREEALCLVTGESLSQVASQTLSSIRFTNSMTDLPMFRPLAGMDKEEIIRIARKIDTFETSILPYEDCCTLFSQKHPILYPDFEKMHRSYAALQIDDILNDALLRGEIIQIDGNRGC